MALQTRYGLGFSPLSIKNVKEWAFNEESVANKDVGMYGIVVGDDKNVVSAEYVARSKAQLDTFVNRLIADNTIGKLWKLTVDNELVRIITESSGNLIEDAENLEINNGTARIKGVRFNIDLDFITKERSMLKYNGEIRANIMMTIKIGSYSKVQIINDTVVNINSTAYALDYTGLEDATGDVILAFESFEIIPPTGFDFDVNTLALYDVLIATIPMPTA